MSTVIISKEQAKFARYLANKAFEKKGTAKKVDGKKERTYITAGCALIWTEVPVTEGIEVEVLKAVWGDKEYSGGMLVYDSRHMDFMAAASILGCDGETEKPEAPVADKTLGVFELPPRGLIKNEAECLEALASLYPRAPAKDVPTAGCELSASANPDADSATADTSSDTQTTQACTVPTPDPKPAMSLHAKYTMCATIRLAHDLGYPLDTPLKEIVEKEGTSAVLRYQEILRKVPAYGLTEARLKFAFPVEYAHLP